MDMGSSLFSRAEKKSQLGKGGFGDVWHARVDEDDVALKVLAESDPDSISRFKKEVRLLKSLDHPNVIKVTDVQLSTAPYCYIMPLYTHSLRSVIPDLAGDTDRVERIFSSILSGVNYIHSQGIAHRDLKPDNVLLNSDDDVVVSDLGLGRAVDSNSTRITMTGDRLGTFAYMAPEQFTDAKSAGMPADTFALGKILYEMLTGEFPQTIDYSKLPHGFSYIIEKATKTAPEDRFETIERLAEAFSSIFSGLHMEVAGEALERLVPELVQGKEATKEVIDQLAESLEGFIGKDDDKIHDIVMQVPAQVTADLASSYLQLARRLIMVFCKHAGAASWGFSYTDKIANVCKNLFCLIHDHEIRAELVNVVLLVGTRHNRFFVMETFAELLRECHSAVEAEVIASRIERHKGPLNAVEQYVTVDNLFLPLRHLFVLSDDGSEDGTKEENALFF